MTCIVAIAHEGKVYMGADSAGVAGLDMAVRADRKVFVNKGFLIGFTSSFRMGQLLQHKFDPPRRHPDDDVYSYMVKEFVESVRRLLAEGGFRRRDNEVETGGTFLVGHAGRLFRIDEDFQVGERALPFDACGCGEAYALGSLFETKKLSGQASPKDRVTSALTAAQEFSAGVRGPFHIESIS